MTDAGAQRQGLIRANEGASGPKLEMSVCGAVSMDSAKKAAEKYSHGKQSFTEPATKV
jgi:hypothetical protein